MKKTLIAILVLSFFVSLIIFPYTASAEKLAITAADVINNVLPNKRLVIIGENISDEYAAKVAEEENAYPWYSKTTGRLKKFYDLTMLDPVKEAPHIVQLLDILKAIKESGSHWDIIVTEKGRSRFYRVLKFFQDKELEGSNVTFILYDFPKKNWKMFRQIKRIFGDNDNIKYELRDW